MKTDYYECIQKIRAIFASAPGPAIACCDAYDLAAEYYETGRIGSDEYLMCGSFIKHEWAMAQPKDPHKKEDLV